MNKAQLRDKAARKPKGNVEVGKCSGCNAEIMSYTMAKGGAIHLGNGKYLCNNCEGG